jgi:hypothetical protein
MQTLIATDSAALIAALARCAKGDGPMSMPGEATSAWDADGPEILALLQKGWSCRGIALALGVGVPTIKARLMRLYRQAGQHKRPR